MLKEEIQTLWRFSAILIGLALPMQLFGPAVVSVCIILGIVCGLLATKGSSLRSSTMFVLQTPMLKIMAGVYAAFLLSALFGIDSGYSMRYFWQLLGIGVGATALFVVMREMPGKYTRIALQSLCFATIFIIIVVLVDAFVDDPRLGGALHGVDKASSAYRLHMMSSVLAILLPFLWAWLMRKDLEREVFATWFAIPLVLLGFWAVFVCGGRSGWLAMGASSLVFLVFASRYHGLIIHRWHWLLGVAAIITGPLLYGLANGLAIMKERVLLASETLGPGAGRLDIWKFAWEHMFDNPITGIGLNAFRQLEFPPEGLASHSHPHNFILQIMLETGVLGSVAVAVMLLYVFYNFFRYAQGNLYGLAGLASLIAFCVAALTNTSIFHGWWLLFFIVPVIFATRIGWSRK